MEVYKLLSVLLAYPQQELIESIKEIKTRFEQTGIDYQVMSPLLETLQDNDLITLQEQYVQTFDRTPTHSLHLFEHLHGEDRARGQAMVDLINEYQQQGYEPDVAELPDYLPLFLEFLSICEAEQAKALLGEAIHVIAYIGQNLQKNQSPYAVIFDLLQLISDVEAQPLTVAPIRDMDEALERFGPNLDGVEPLLSQTVNYRTNHKQGTTIPVRMDE